MTSIDGEDHCSGIRICHAGTILSFVCYPCPKEAKDRQVLFFYFSPWVQSSRPLRALVRAREKGKLVVCLGAILGQRHTRLPSDFPDHILYRNSRAFIVVTKSLLDNLQATFCVLHCHLGVYVSLAYTCTRRTRGNNEFVKSIIQPKLETYIRREK